MCNFEQEGNNERSRVLIFKGEQETLRLTVLRNHPKQPAEFLCIDIIDDQEQETGIAIPREKAIDILKKALNELGCKND